MKYLATLLFLFCSFFAAGQKQVAITIDDVPRTNNYQKSEQLLSYLTKNEIPATIFINESRVVRDSMPLNVALLEKWISSPMITPGNHTYSHPRYSTSDFNDYTEEIRRGEYLTRALSQKYDKELKHFRFPFNDLGANQMQQDSIREYLNSLGYRIAPFTIESSDYMYSYLYDHYTKIGDEENAARVGNAYVEKTVELFHFFDSLANAEYDRSIPQIFLCHDFPLNTDFLPKIISQLKDYEFITYDKALEDEVYDQTNTYYKKWGISWFYRWMDEEKRSSYQKIEPSVMSVYQEYKSVQEKAN